MTTRRDFLRGLAGAAALPVVGSTTAAALPHPATTGRPGAAPELEGGAAAPTAPPLRQAPPASRMDPWVEVVADALRANAAEVSRLAGGRPIMAVLKNNAYGLGTVEAARILADVGAVAGYAVVRAEAAARIAQADTGKPVLLMALADDDAAAELVRSGVRLSFCTDGAAEQARRIAHRTGAAVPGHAYLDTGMGRMGVPAHRALPWFRELAAAGVRVEGTFMAFTEEADFDPVQLQRFRTFASEARAAGLDTGSLHAASSHGLFHLPEAHLDMVRPGMALYGGYPADAKAESRMATLTPAVRLRARVVRVERLRAGDGVSYGRNYVAERPTWVATIPVGHADGYPRAAVRGARVLIGGRTYPVIGAVSASHTIVEVGDEQTVAVGEVATLLGPDHADVHPNRTATAIEGSVYDLLMHINPALPRYVV